MGKTFRVLSAFFGVLCIICGICCGALYLVESFQNFRNRNQLSIKGIKDLLDDFAAKKILD